MHPYFVQAQHTFYCQEPRDLKLVLLQISFHIIL